MRYASVGLVCLATLACDTIENDNAATGTASSAEFRLTEDLRIDGYEADLVPVGRLEVAANGTIAVLQGQDHIVRFFDSAGLPVGEIGGSGEGPGEFTRMTGAGWLADTLWIYDSGQRRFTLISPELEFVRNVLGPTQARPSPEAAGRYPEFRMVAPQHLYSDSSVFATLLFPLGGQGNTTNQTTHARVSLDGVLRSILLAYAVDDSGVSIRTESGTAGASMPFSIRPSYDVSGDGARIAVVEPVVEGPSAETFTVTVVTAAGDTVFSRVYPFDGVPIPEDVADSTIEARAQSLQERVPQLADAYRKEARVPPFYPPVEGILNGRDRTVWIRLREVADGRPYLVLSPDGDVLGTVVLPASTTIAAADLDTIWVLETDENDVQSVVRYRVSRE